MSIIKKELNQLRISFPQILKAFILFLFSCSGLGIALFLRFLDYNGTIIAFIAILVESIAMVLNYFMFRTYFREKKESKQEISRKSQSYK